MRKKAILLGSVLLLLVTIFLLVNNKTKEDQLENQQTGGYGTYLQHLNVTIDEVAEKHLIVISNEDTILPETVKKGGKIREVLTETLDEQIVGKGQNVKLR